MLKVYGRTNSSNVMKVHWCLAELKVPFEPIDLGGPFGTSTSAEYLALNPNGLVPTIVDGDFVLWESHVIVRYLAAKYGIGTLLPQKLEARASADRWMDWHASVLAPALSPLFYGLVRTKPADRNLALISAARDRTATAFAILDAQLARTEYVAGSGFTMGDIPVGILTYRWYTMDVRREDYKSLRTWYARLCARPAFQKQVMIGIS